VFFRSAEHIVTMESDSQSSARPCAKTTLVFTANGHCLRMPREMAQRSEFFSTQLEWECDEDEPQLFAPGLNKSLMLMALQTTSFDGLTAVEHCQIVDAAEMLGVQHKELHLKALSPALKRCRCGAHNLQNLEEAHEPKYGPWFDDVTSCSFVQCWDNARHSYWLDSLLNDCEILSEMMLAAIAAGRLDMFIHSLQRAKNEGVSMQESCEWMLDRVCTGSSIRRDDVREWFVYLLELGVSVPGFMRCMRAAQQQGPAQQCLLTLAGSPTMRLPDFECIRVRTSAQPVSCGFARLKLGKAVRLVGRAIRAPFVEKVQMRWVMAQKLVAPQRQGCRCCFRVHLRERLKRRIDEVTAEFAEEFAEADEVTVGIAEECAEPKKHFAKTKTAMADAERLLHEHDLDHFMKAFAKVSKRRRVQHMKVPCGVGRCQPIKQPRSRGRTGKNPRGGQRVTS